MIEPNVELLLTRRYGIAFDEGGDGLLMFLEIADGSVLALEFSAKDLRTRGVLVGPDEDAPPLHEASSPAIH